MNRWRWVGVLALVAAVAVGVTAYGREEGEPRPVWKGLEGDKPFWQEMTTETTQTMKVQGMEVVQRQNQTFIVQWTPKGKGDKGGQKVEYKIVAVKMDIQIGGNNIAYNSMAKEQPPQNPLTDFFKTLVGSSFTLTVATDEKDGTRVTDVEGLEEFVKKLSQANEQLKPLLQKILDKEAIKQMSNPTFAAYPKSDAEYKTGTWESKITLSMGPIGTYETKYVYKKDSKDPNKVAVTADMTYSPPKASDTAAANLPFIIKGGDLKADNATGTITFDPKTGNIASSEMKMDVKGTLKIEIAGMETSVDLNQTQKSTLVTKYEDPLKK